MQENQSQFGTNTGTENSGVADQARKLVASAQDKTAEQMKSGFNSGKSRAADTLHDVARALRTSSDELNANAPGGTARYVEQVADSVQRFADFVETAEPGEIIHRTEDFARRQPAVILGGAFALGLIAARFLKSSRRGDQPDYQSRGWQSDARRPEMFDRERSLTGFSEPSADRYGASGTASGYQGSSAGTSGSTGSFGNTGSSATTDPLRQNTGGTGNDPLRYGSSTAGSALDDNQFGSSGTGRNTGSGTGSLGSTGATGGASGTTGGTKPGDSATDATRRAGGTGSTGFGPDGTERR